ncbi:MAG: glycine-rich protein [bacterium]|nr:glycine-rich protein [bacterium]
MKQFAKYIFSTVFVLQFCHNPYRAQVTLTYTFTGSPESFTVPSCVTTLSLTAKGARGGTNAMGVLGGLGGTAFGVLTVSPGDVLTIFAGGTNGYNGGGLAGVSTCTVAIGGAGGGGSDVRLNGNSLANRVIVGGGGGGAGGNRIMNCGRGTGGGGGGGYYGGGGGAGNPGISGYVLPTGGSQTAGGIAGTSGWAFWQGGYAGTLWTGGAGGTESYANQGSNFTVTAFTGGDGGGLTGGPGQYSLWNGEIYTAGCGGSGGGGSSYLGSLLSAYTTSGNISGSGEVVISYTTSIGVMPLNFIQANICVGGSATLNAPSQVSYTWSTGSNSSNVIVSPLVNTTYSVSGTNSLGCISLGVITVTVDGTLPSVTINSSSNSICQGNFVTLSGAGANSYTWSGGVSNASPFIPTSTLTYSITGANGCGTATAVVTVSVNPNPTLSANPSSVTLCPGNSTALSASGANSYTWTGGILNGSAFIPPSTNVYTVTGTNVFGCTGTSTAAVTVLPGPSLSPVPSPSSLCMGETCTISAQGAGNYTWMPGASNASIITVSPTITTVYSLTQSIGNCIDIKTVSVIVNGLPSVIAMASPSIVCSLGNTTLSGAGALGYTWQPYGGAGATVVVSPTVSTIFTLSASDGTCANSTTVSLITQPIPTLTIAVSPSVVCPGDSATLTVSGASLYNWMPPAGTGSAIVVNPFASSSYSATGTNSLGCSSTVSQFIFVKTIPPINISATNPLVCKGGTSTLSALGADTYSWTGGPANPIWVVNPTSTATFSVKGTFINIGCASIQTITVVVFEPQFTITGNTAVCVGGTATLTATGAFSYIWNGNFPFPSISVSPTLYTVYQVSATSSSNNVICTSTQSIGVQVNPNPTVTAVASRSVICKGESVNLLASGATTYTWNTFPPGASVTVAPAGQQNYTVTGTDANGCRDVAFVSVKVSACTGVKEIEASNVELLICPNPNRGEFEIVCPLDINLSLVNAVGQLIRYIHLSDLNNHKEHISIAAPGVYFIIDRENKQLFTQKIFVGN